MQIFPEESLSPRDRITICKPSQQYNNQQSYYITYIYIVKKIITEVTKRCLQSNIKSTSLIT